MGKGSSNRDSSGTKVTNIKYQWRWIFLIFGTSVGYNQVGYKESRKWIKCRRREAPEYRRG